MRSRVDQESRGRRPTFRRTPRAACSGLTSSQTASAVVRRQRFEHVGNVGGVHRAQPLAEFGHVLPVLQLLEEVALGTVLLMRQRLEHAMAVEQPGDFGQAVCEPRSEWWAAMPHASAVTAEMRTVTRLLQRRCRRMSCREWNSGSCLVTSSPSSALPLAIFTYWQQQRKERENEDEETYQLLSDAYTDFLKLVMANPDLQAAIAPGRAAADDEQHERRQVVFEMLVSLFERAYLLAYDDEMTEKQRRRWHSWDDYMREWCRRPDFCAMLPQLLEGEDPDFVACIQRIASEESLSRGAAGVN